MTRKNIFETIAGNYNVINELDKISNLFDSPLVIYTDYPRHTEYTFEKLVDSIFYKWKSRESCINCADMRNELSIDRLSRKSYPTEDEIISCLEYYENILDLTIKHFLSVDPLYRLRGDGHILQQNIDKLLDHLNYEKRFDKKQERVILVPKNPAATAIAEISSDDVAMAIFKYNHASLKGQLEEKRRLLASIYKEYESLFYEGVKGFEDYFEEARALVNNLDIRHNNKEGKYKKEPVAKMKSGELEKWYDELYQLLLFCVLARENQKRKDKAAKLLKTLKSQKEPKNA